MLKGIDRCRGRLSEQPSLAWIDQNFAGVYPDPVLQDLKAYFDTVIGNMRVVGDLGESKLVVNGAEEHKIGALGEFVEGMKRWIRIADPLGPTPDVHVENPPGKEEVRFLNTLKSEFAGRKILLLPDGGEEQELTVGKATRFPAESGFTMRPVIPPVRLRHGDRILFDEAPGHPRAQEWRHFNYEESFSGLKTRGELVCSFGWTEDGLLGQAASVTKKGGATADREQIYGHWGLGYLSSDLNESLERSRTRGQVK